MQRRRPAGLPVAIGAGAKWLVGLTLAVELCGGGLPPALEELLSGHPRAPPDDRATHCAASGVAFSYTVAGTRAASGRAYAASHMAAGLPLPGIGRGAVVMRLRKPSNC